MVDGKIFNNARKTLLKYFQNTIFKPWTIALLTMTLTMVWKSNMIVIKRELHLSFMSQPWHWACDQVKSLQGCGPRRKPKSHISCSRECKRVWGNKPSHSQVNSHYGSWNFDGLPNFQRATAGVKTHWIEEFLILLKSFWNIDI